MLREAVKKHEATVPPSRGPTHNSLSKQLFPSSSPTLRDGNISEQIKKTSAPSGAINPTRRQPQAVTGYLKPKSANVQTYSRPPAPGKGLSSLYGASSESFKDIAHSFGSAATSAGRNAAPVYFAENDFSDDENLDLNFEAPSALPALPVAHTAKEIAKTEPSPPPPAINSSAIPWSSSPPWHHRAPSQQSTETLRSQQSSKRGSLENDADLQPAPKKRVLPKHWAEGKDSEPGQMEAAQVPPVQKSKDFLPWDTNAVAVKARKQALKIQSRKQAADEGATEEGQDTAKNHRAKQSAISLTKEQSHIKELVIANNQSVFFTGPAGTGKSVLMRAIIQELKKKWVRDPERLAVTASTGLAACNIGGMTLHSFSGIGLGKEDVPTLVKKVRRNQKAKNRWLRTKTLIIDEISMVDGDLFDKLSQIGRTIRNNGRPWGGIQLVITGDFFQLPPVPDWGNKREVKFAFEAATWNTSIDHTIGLTEVFRQKDHEFASMLNEMRLGRISEQTVKSFKGLARPLQFDDGLEMTELFPTRQEVESSNDRRLKALGGKSYTYDAQDKGELAIRDKLLQNMMAPKMLELKEGAQVMLIKNLDETLVNGSIGTVTKFGKEEDDLDELGSSEDMDPMVRKRIKAFGKNLENTNDGKKKYPVVRFYAMDGSAKELLITPNEWKVETPQGEVQASREQLPLILAWALSIHKAQGQTLQRVKVDLGKVFEKGQAYVALSRATSQQGLQVLRFEKHKVMAHPRVIGFYNRLYSADVAVKKKPQSIADYGNCSKTSKTVVEIDEDEEQAMMTYG